MSNRPFLTPDPVFFPLAVSLVRLLPAGLLIWFVLWFFQPLGDWWWPFLLTGILSAWLWTSRTAAHPPGHLLSSAEAPELVDMLRALARRAGLPRTPGLVLVSEGLINAAASLEGGGRVYVTSGLLRHLNRRELLGVLAHEISHLKHGDLWISRILESLVFGAQTLALGALWFLPLTFLGALQVLVLTVLLPPVVRYFYRSFLREREYAADAGAARLTGDPEGLAGALARIEYRQGRPWWWPLPQSRNEGTHPDSHLRIRKLLTYPGGTLRTWGWDYS